MSDKCPSNLELFGPPKNGKNYTFEECHKIIIKEIMKRKKRWLLHRIAYLDYDDVSQIIQLHIFKKWYLWDQTQPIMLWLNKTITNQSINQVRNHYLSRTCICTSCPLNLGGGICREYGNTRSIECNTYNIWATSKKFDKEQVNFPISIHELEDNAQERLICQNSLNPIHDIDRFHELVLKKLTPLQQQIYKWMYLENKSDEEISKLMGYAPSIQPKRTPGYRMITKFKSIFIKSAKEVLEYNDF